MEEKDMEIEPNAPDWSKEPASDQLLADSLRERLDKPILRRQLGDWREREKIKKMLDRLNDLGFTKK